ELVGIFRNKSVSTTSRQNILLFAIFLTPLYDMLPSRNFQSRSCTLCCSQSIQRPCVHRPDKLLYFLPVLRFPVPPPGAGAYHRTMISLISDTLLKISGRFTPHQPHQIRCTDCIFFSYWQQAHYWKLSLAGLIPYMYSVISVFFLHYFTPDNESKY